MPDETLELHLRRALADGADRHPLTLTVADLEAALTRRRRDRTGRRIVAVAVAAAAVAVVSIVALGNGWLQMATVGTSEPRPPVPVASADPAVVGPNRPSLGAAGDAIVVSPIVDPSAGAQAFEVHRWPATGEREVLARFSGLIGADVAGADVSPNQRTRVSPDGYLAVPFDYQDDGAFLGYGLYDLADATRDPIILEGLGADGLAWSPDGRLALFDGGGMVTIVDPSSGERMTLRSPQDVFAWSVGTSDERAWAADGQALLAMRSNDATGTPGVLGLDGSFREDGTPDLFLPTGLERDADAQGRRLGTGCRAFAAPTNLASDCQIMAEPWGGGSPTTLADLPDSDRVAGVAWDRTFQGAWVLLQRYASAAEDAQPVSVDLLHVAADGTIATTQSIAIADPPGNSEPAILGISSDDGRVAIQLRSDYLAVVDTATGEWHPIGGGWDRFAGWAAQRGE